MAYVCYNGDEHAKHEFQVRIIEVIHFVRLDFVDSSKWLILSNDEKDLWNLKFMIGLSTF